MRKNVNKITNLNFLQKRLTGKIIVFTLVMVLLFTTCDAMKIQNRGLTTLTYLGRSITWDVTLNCSNPDGQNDYVIFGEAPDAGDGSPPDIYDTPKPPAPFPPYIRTWLNDNLPAPYDSLLEDFRHYPDINKVWNLTIHWMPSSGSSPTTITVSWLTSEVDDSEYASVDFCTDAGTILKNMLIYNSYTFSCPAYVPQNFKIICAGNVNNPPVAYPDTYGTNVDTTLMIAAPGVLANDVDADGDTLTAVKMSDPSHGTVTLNSNGGFIYIPVTNYLGTDTFTYKASDGIDYSNIATVTILVQQNAPPLKPQKPTGPASGKVHIEYTYNATTTDPNNNQLYFQWNWGDGTTSDWFGPYKSGEITQAKHTWTKKGSYGITVRAKDIYGAESNWSESLPITMPFSHEYIGSEIGALFHLVIRILRGEFAGMTFIQILRMEGWIK